MIVNSNKTFISHLAGNMHSVHVQLSIKCEGGVNNGQGHLIIHELYNYRIFTAECEINITYTTCSKSFFMQFAHNAYAFYRTLFTEKFNIGSHIQNTVQPELVYSCVLYLCVPICYIIIVHYREKVCKSAGE